MNRNLHISGAILLFLAILMSVTATILNGSAILGSIILGLSAAKFLLVSFQFMEIKKAHAFWKTILVVFILLVFSSFILLI